MCLSSEVSFPQSVWKVQKGFGSFSTVLQIISDSLGMYGCCLMMTHCGYNAFWSTHCISVCVLIQCIILLLTSTLSTAFDTVCVWCAVNYQLGFMYVYVKHCIIMYFLDNFVCPSMCECCWILWLWNESEIYSYGFFNGILLNSWMDCEWYFLLMYKKHTFVWWLDCLPFFLQCVDQCLPFEWRQKAAYVIVHLPPPLPNPLTCACDERCDCEPTTQYHGTGACWP